MSAPASADLMPLVSREQAGNTIGTALRLYVGRRRRYSVKQLANGAGIKDRVIECAMCDPASCDYRPLPLEAFLSIALFLGPEFTTECLSPAKQGAFDLPDGVEPPPGDLAADNSDDNAVVTRAAMDGVFDRDERPVLRSVGKRMMNRGAQLVQLGAAA